MQKRSISSILLIFLLLPGYAQQVVVNTVGKDPFNGKASEVVYKAKDGQWTFQSFARTIIKTTFRPADYTRGEQVSDAVIAQPAVLTTKITAGVSQTVEWENQSSVVIQRDRLYYKSGKEVKVKAATYFSNDKERGFRFQLSDGERIFGAGERALPDNRRGYRLKLYNESPYGYALGATTMGFSVPFIISSNGYAIFFDNPSKGYLDIGLTDNNILEAGFTGGELTYYVILGKNIDEIMFHYGALTGRQPLPPRWAFGNFVSRFGYRSEQQVKEVVEKMKEEQFPMDALVFDLFWFGDDVKGTLGNLDWTNTAQWPNPKGMLDRFRSSYHLKSILITQPYILQGTKNFEEAKPFLATDANGQPYMLKDFYFGTGGLIDIFRKPARDWFWKHYKKQIGNGVAGWWSGLGEPSKHPEEMVHNLKDYGITRPMLADEVHNIYGHYWNKMLYEKYTDEYSGTRLFNLAASGFAGSQRYSIFPWTGDAQRSWGGLKAQPLIMLGMSLSGLPYIHSDAGGFVPATADAELYTRWLQFAAFTPVFRPHGAAGEAGNNTSANMRPEPCFHEGPVKSIVRNYIQWRYQLLPYNYTLAYEQAAHGKPLMRPLYYYSFADSNLFKAEDEYLWGDQLLVAPVTVAGATARMVYLPKGKWYNYRSNAITEGGQWINVPVDQKDIPVFVKEGSFVPLWITQEPVTSTESYDSKDITIRYYPSSNTSAYVWFDDDGESTRTLEKAAYELVTFEGETKGNNITIRIKTNNPNNYRRKFTRKFRIEIAGAADNEYDVRVNGKALPATAFQQQTDPVLQAPHNYVVIEFEGKPLTVEMNKR